MVNVAGGKTPRTDRTGECAICGEAVAKHYDRRNRFGGCKLAIAGTAGTDAMLRTLVREALGIFTETDEGKTIDIRDWVKSARVALK